MTPEKVPAGTGFTPAGKHGYVKMAQKLYS